MYNTTPEEIALMKREIAAVQREREVRCPYSAKLKRQVVNYAVEVIAETGPLHDISGRLGLDGDHLVHWFKEAFEREVSLSSEE